MSRRKKWSFLWILIPIVLVVAFLLLSTHYLIDPDLYRKIIQDSLTTALDREVLIGKAKISLWGGVGITFEDFRVKDRSLSFDLLQSKRLILKAKWFPLLKREVKWKRVVFERPTFRLLRDRKGGFNFFDGPLSGEELKASKQKVIQTLSTLFGGSLTLRDGEISFSDETIGDSPLVTEIRSFHFELSEVSYQKTFPFRMNGKIGHSKKEGQFSIVGTIQNILEDMDLSKGKVEAEVETKGIETFHFWPYLKTLLPMKMISGTLDLHAHYRRDFSGAFKTSTKINFKDVLFDYPQVFSYVLKPKWVSIDLEVDYDLKDLRVPRLSVELPEIGLKGKGKIYAIGTKETGIEAEVQSGPFDLSEGKKFIPYRIIKPDVSDALFRAEGSGSVQIVSVRLAGKLPEIDHCDQPAHAHVLSVEMKINGARLKLPWDLPPLEELKGHLLFKEGHLNFKEVEGRVFHSRIDRADGTFYQLLLIPTLQIHSEGRIDLMDLPSLAKTEAIPDELSEALSSINILSGRAEYRLFAKGVLKRPFRFQHQEVYHLSKTRFTHRQIPFPLSIGEGKIDLSNEALRWSEAKVQFGNSSLLMSGLWKHGEKNHLQQITARGRIDLKNLFALFQTPLFPEEIRLKTKGIETLSGTGQFSFKGGRLAGHQFFSYEGELIPIPKEAHLFLKGVSTPLAFRDGALSFSNIGMSLSKTKVQFGSTSLTVEGSIQEGNLNLATWGSIDLNYLESLLQLPLFSDQMRSHMDGIRELTGRGEVRLKWLGRLEQWPTAVKEGEIRLKEVSLRYQRIPVLLSHIEGSFFFSPEQIRFDGLKGKLGDSRFTVSGGIPRSSLQPMNSSAPSASQSLKPGEVISSTAPGRWLSFQISSPLLDLDLFFPKKTEGAPTSFEKVREWLSDWNIEGKVEADQVRYHGFFYQALRTEMKSVDGKLFFRPFQFKGDGGDLWGEGWIEPAERGVRFEIKPRLSNMEAKAFLRTLFPKREEEEKVVVTGKVHIDKVELRGEGEDFQKVKASLSGVLRLEMENGAIERFNILSKIFSILNVSQLLRGRFPDLKTKGLPYHQIIANIHVKDGIASTEDLVVDSDAMKITLFGKVDVGKNLIDAKIGIHPLVTLDTVLSKLPIAGYILTGKDKAFLSYIYEVKGDLDDPKIEAIPFKGLGEGFFGIIKRLLETPLRPFQKSL